MLAHIVCFKCEECTYKVNLLGVLKNHNNCIHESKCWILPKASFGFSNNFDCELCTRNAWFEEMMKNYMYWIHASETWTIPKGKFWYSLVLNAKYALTYSIL